MDKISFLKNQRLALRDTLRISRNYRQHKYHDRVLNSGSKTPFRHDWHILAHMHDLRLWTIAYAPSRLNNLQRLQELHLLNQEMWYQVSSAMWKRLIAMIGLWFLITRFAKDRYLNQGNFDSHDAQYRETPAHL
jgi:hypothetical protein